MSGSPTDRDDVDLDEARRRFTAALNLLLVMAERRQGRNISRPSLAKRLNISTASLYAYLNGTTLPRSGVLDGLLQELGAGGEEAGRIGTLRDSAEVAQRTRGRTIAEPVLVELPRPRQPPAVTTQFVGRSTELASLDELIDRPSPTTPTIIVLTGTAGVGKTTLALRWADRIADRYPDGCLHVDLRGFDPGAPTEPEQALYGFLYALGVAASSIPADVDTRAALYRTLLAGRRMLVVLDNARSSDQVRPLLPGAPTSTVVITSRDRLDSLVVREGATRLYVETLPHADALALLARHIPSARLAAEAEAADHLIRYCVHLPLALSIVAARAATKRGQQPLSTLATELLHTHDRLNVLASDSSDIDIRTVFHWSYSVLPETAARLFRLLGAHPGPDVDAYCCAALLDAATLPQLHLDRLVAENLVAEQRPGRFSCHDLLRAYARERHEADDPAIRRRVLQRLLDYYLDTAILANEHIQPCRADGLGRLDTTWPQPPMASYAEAMAWLEDEQPAIRSMITLAATSQGLEPYAWRLAWACTVFLRRTGRRTERAAVNRIATEAALRVGDRVAYATSLRLQADALARLGRTGDSRGYLYTALAEFQALGDEDGLRQTHLSLVRVHEADGNNIAALAHAHDALRLARATDDRLAHADGLTAVSKQECLLGRLARARSRGLQALTLYAQLGHSEGQADVLMNVGLTEHHLRRYDDAISRYQQSLELDRLLGDRYWEAQALRRLADTHDAAGQPDVASRHRVDALTILESLHHPDAELLRTGLTRPGLDPPSGSDGQG